MSARREPPKRPAPTVELHTFDEDPEVPGEERSGRRVCRCGKLGRPGDDQHPDGAPPLAAVFDPAVVLRPVPEEDVSKRITGESE